MDIYESAMPALKIPFFPLGLRFPTGDVLNAVVINWMVRFSVTLYSTSLLMPNERSLPYFYWGVLEE